MTTLTAIADRSEITDPATFWTIFIIVGATILAALHVRNTWREKQADDATNRAARVTRRTEPMCAVIHPRPCHQPAITVRHGWPTCRDHTRRGAA